MKVRSSDMEKTTIQYTKNGETLYHTFASLPRTGYTNLSIVHESVFNGVKVDVHTRSGYVDIKSYLARLGISKPAVNRKLIQSLFDSMEDLGSDHQLTLKKPDGTILRKLHHPAIFMFYAFFADPSSILSNVASMWNNIVTNKEVSDAVVDIYRKSGTDIFMILDRNNIREKANEFVPFSLGMADNICDILKNHPDITFSDDDYTFFVNRENFSINGLRKLCRSRKLCHVSCNK